MLKKLRENVYIGDAEAYKKYKTLSDLDISSILVVADDLENDEIDANQEPRVFKMGLRKDRMNPPHIKDLVCHTALQMANNGDIILIQSVTGLERAAFVACRVICELEQKSIYEVMLELKELIPEFDISKSYF